MGDLKNCGTKLDTLLRTSKYPYHVDYSFLFYGHTKEFMPLLHFIFQDYSMAFTKYLLHKGYEMGGKSDSQIMDTIYKVLRDEFSYIPKLHKAKFLSDGFAEQKLLMLIEVYSNVIEKSKSFNKKAKKRTKKAVPNIQLDMDNKENEIPKPFSKTVEETEKEVSFRLPAPSPIRTVPQPDVYQRSAIMPDDIWEDSIVILPDSQPSNPSVKVYSEEGARHIYALSHHTAHDIELDSTPTTVLTRVEEMPIVEESTMVTPTRDKVSTQHCTCSQEVTEIKRLLISLHARMDIAECKIKRIEGPSAQYKPPKSCLASQINEVVRIPFGEEADESTSRPRGPTTLDTTTSPEDIDDIKSFILSAKERLNNTRSFLRSYNVDST